ncbi:MAG: cupin domain-containing protein [Candidatus Cyclobacteriaceae bacterium M3_2C_046]
MLLFKLKNTIRSHFFLGLLLFFTSSNTTSIMANTDLILENAQKDAVLLKDDGTFPNNDNLPLLVYKQAIDLNGSDPASRVEQVFQSNQWGNSWRNGIYSYHHYHSTAHEVLGIYSGSAKVQLGGPEGEIFEVEKGDVIVIPAGVAHKNLGASPDFACVGAYPPGQNWDMNYGKEGERPQADQNIARVPLPETDPVFGSQGFLLEKWQH